MKKFNFKEGLVVYDGEEDKLMVDNFVIKKIPIWKLLLTSDLREMIKE